MVSSRSASGIIRTEPKVRRRPTRNSEPRQVVSTGWVSARDTDCWHQLTVVTTLRAAGDLRLHRKDDDFTDWLTRDSRSPSRHFRPPTISSHTFAETAGITALSRCAFLPRFVQQKLEE